MTRTQRRRFGRRALLPLRSDAPDAVTDTRLVLPCVILSIILLLVPIAVAPAVAQQMLYPRGLSYTYTVPFTQDDIGDYKLLVAGAGISDIVDPDEVLLSVTPVQGSGFVIAPRSGVTIAEYLSAFPTAGDLRPIIRPAAVYTSDGTFVEQVLESLEWVFDASAQFVGASPSALHTQLWTKAAVVYEGDAGADALGFSWTVVGPGAKTWGLGSMPTIQCTVRGNQKPRLHKLEPDDSALFEFGQFPSAAEEGSVQFKSAPDFEVQPNVYHVRVYNTHMLNEVGHEGSRTGCNGSALDLAVTVLDVGAPAQVAGVSATKSDNILAVSWDAPETDVNGTPFSDLAAAMQVTRYDYRYRTFGATSWTEADTGDTSTSVDITVPEASASYELQVSALNGEGTGAWSEPVRVRPPAGPPLNLAAAAGDSKVTLDWEPPSSTGGVDVQRYEYRVDGGAWMSTGTARRAEVRGLTNDQEYSFDVRAVTVVGNGEWATVTAMPKVAPPSAPLNLRASPGDGRVTLVWEAPSSTGGLDVQRYEYRVDGGAWMSSGTARRAVVTGLTNGQEYSFDVRAVTAGGDGEEATVTAKPRAATQPPPPPPPPSNVAPSFPKAEYAFELSEHLDGSGQGVALGHVTAEDPDDDAVEHALARGDTRRFTVRAQDGALAYIGPGEDFEAGPRVYILTVQARDPAGAEARVRVVVTVTAVNEPPTARDDEARTEEDTTVVVDVLDNDTDPDGDPLHVETLSVAEHGAVQVVDGGVAYTPEADFHGADRFTYAVSDGRGLTSTASVDVTVLAVNDAPEPVGAIPDQTLDEGGDPATIELAGFFEDRDGDALTFRAISSDTAVTRVTVTAALLTVTAVQLGTAAVTVSAEDQDGAVATQAFDVGVSDQLAKAVVGDTLAAMGRGHLASARMILGRRARTGGSEPSRVTVMGRELPLGRTEAWTSAEQIPASRLPLPGTRRHTRSGGFPGMAASGNLDAALLGGQGGLDGGWDEALRRSSFQLGVQTGDEDEAGEGRAWTFWGQGDNQAFRGARDTRSGYEGGVTTGYLGVDTQLTDRWLAGVAVARSSGGGDWRAGSSRGRLGTTLTTVQPYARWSDGTTSVWTTAGVGRGTAENVRESTGRGETSGLGLALGLVEVRRRMGTVAGGIRLGLRGDLAWARLSTDAGRQTVDGVRAAVGQMRVGVELSRPYRMQNGLVVTPFGELHVRRDGGAGQTGAGLEVAPGVSARRFSGRRPTKSTSTGRTRISRERYRSSTGYGLGKAGGHSTPGLSCK